MINASPSYYYATSTYIISLRAGNWDFLDKQILATLLSTFSVIIINVLRIKEIYENSFKHVFCLYSFKCHIQAKAWLASDGRGPRTRGSSLKFTGNILTCLQSDSNSRNGRDSILSVAMHSTTSLSGQALDGEMQHRAISTTPFGYQDRPSVARVSQQSLAMP